MAEEGGANPWHLLHLPATQRGGGAHGVQLRVREPRLPRVAGAWRGDAGFMRFATAPRVGFSAMPFKLCRGPTNTRAHRPVARSGVPRRLCAPGPVPFATPNRDLSTPWVMFRKAF